MRLLKLFLLLWMVCLVVPACASPTADLPQEIIATQPPATPETADPIAEVLSQNPELALFVNAMISAGVLAQLEGDGPFTVFAPTNEAFSKIGLATFQIDPIVLQQVMSYHVVRERVMVADGVTAVSFPTLYGESITFSGENSTPKVNYATITTADIPASNGVIHIVNAVLLPSEQNEAEKSVWGTLVNDGRFSRLVALMGGSETMYLLRFNDAADAFLAPTDEAFAAIPSDITDLFSQPDSYDLLFSFLTLTPDGWPRGTPLTTADMIEMGEIPTRVARSAPGFGASGFANGFEKLPVIETADGLMIGDAHVLEGDILANNGIIHVIDKVLLPEALLNPTQQP